MSNKLLNKFKDRKPAELTAEETYEIISEIALSEYQKRNDIKQLQDYMDGADELYTYLLEKDNKGKTGLKALQQKCTMAHFLNILHMETRNGINYIIRKKKNQRFLYETSSLSELNFTESDSLATIEEFIPDTEALFSAELNIEFEKILQSIDDTENKSIVINYGNGANRCTFNFSYRNLTKIYFKNFVKSKLTYKDFKGILYNNSGEELGDDEIKSILSDYRKYIKDNLILGGAF